MCSGLISMYSLWISVYIDVESLFILLMWIFWIHLNVITPGLTIRSDGELLTMHSLWEGSLVPLEYRSATLHLLSMLRHHLYGWLEWWLLPDRVDRWVCWSWFHCSSLEEGQWSLTKQNLQKVWTAKCSQQQKQKREKNENFDMAVSLLFFNLLGYAVFLKFFWCSLVEKPSQFL